MAPSEATPPLYTSKHFLAAKTQIGDCFTVLAEVVQEKIGEPIKGPIFYKCSHGITMVAVWGSATKTWSIEEAPKNE